MIKLEITMSDNNGKEKTQNTRIESIFVDDTVARHISELMLYKQNDRTKEYFKNLEDVNGKIHNIDFEKVLGFEFKQA